jgi:hypothetical protein
VARTRLHWAALAFATAALLSAWNPLAAPFGLVVGIAAALIALRAGARGARRPAWVTALALSLLAALGSALVLARTAGVGRPSADRTIVPAPSQAEIDRELDAAAQQTAPSRARARSELDSVAPESPVSKPPPRKR